MILHVFESEGSLACAAAVIFAAQILRKPDSVIGLATGSTPLGTYGELVRLYEEGVLDFSRVTSFNLDEYVGLPKSHPESYYAFMHRNLFDRINIRDTHLPDGQAEDLTGECRKYDEAIRKAGGVDLQLLGIGSNGHIGFNEPSDRFVYGTNVINLTESTISANRRFFDSADEVPRRAVSMGIGTIMSARSILLLAMGAQKADAIKAMMEDEVDPRIPASILRTHPSVTVLLDKAAAGGLSL